MEKELNEYFSTGRRDVAVTGFHGFALLKNAPQDIRIFVKFPLPATNIHAVELVKQLGAAAFEVEPELDQSAADDLIDAAVLPAFEDDSPLPVLVSRAEIDCSRRKDGIGNSLSIIADNRENTCMIFISRCNVRKKFKEGKLL